MQHGKSQRASAKVGGMRKSVHVGEDRPWKAGLFLCVAQFEQAPAPEFYSTVYSRADKLQITHYESGLRPRSRHGDSSLTTNANVQDNRCEGRSQDQYANWFLTQVR